MTYLIIFIFQSLTIIFSKFILAETLQKNYEKVIRVNMDFERLLPFNVANFGTIYGTGLFFPNLILVET